MPERPSPAPVEDQSSPSFNVLSRLRVSETAMKLTTMAVCAATLVGAAVFARGDNDPGVPRGGHIDTAALVNFSEPHYKAITDFDFQPDRSAVETETVQNVGASGHAVNVIQPDSRMQRSYDSYFPQPEGKDPRPRLTEIINFMDPTHTFSGEYKDHPGKYSFSIFNATKTPVDIEFADYAARAIRYWLNENEGPDGMMIGDSSFVRVKPRHVPHVMILVKNSHDYRAVMGSGGVGATQYSPGHLTKSVIPRDGNRHDPFPDSTIGVELCQSMVNVYDEKTVNLEDTEHMERFVYAFNGSATPENINDLARQESICNMLGRAVAAAYQGGRAGFVNLIRHQGEPLPEPFSPQPWLDYGLAAPELPKFLWLARHIPKEWNEVIAARDENLPTVDYYQLHHHIIP